MLHRLPDAVQVVDADITDPRTRWTDIDKHQRHFAQLQILQQDFFHAEGHDRHALDAPLDHAPHRTLHALGIITSGGQQNLVAILDRNALEDLNNFRKERVGDVRDNEAKDAAASGNRGPSLGIGIISEFFDYAPY